MSTTATPNLLTVPEAARVLRLSRQTVYRLLQRGEIPALKVGGSVRIDSDELSAWLYGRNDRGDG